MQRHFRLRNWLLGARRDSRRGARGSWPVWEFPPRVILLPVPPHERVLAAAAHAPGPTKPSRLKLRVNQSFEAAGRLNFDHAPSTRVEVVIHLVPGLVEYFVLMLQV